MQEIKNRIVDEVITGSIRNRGMGIRLLFSQCKVKWG